MKITLLTGRTSDLQEQILQQLHLKIKIIRSSQAKRLTLRIDSKEHLPVLTMPTRGSEKKAFNFVFTHQDWIINMLSRLPQEQKFCDNCQFSLFGKETTLKHQPHAKGGVYMENGELIVCGHAEFIHRRTTDFLKKLAKTKLTDLAKQKAALIECPINSVTIKDTKSRWGSCSSKNNLNFNWRIIFAPQYVIDYLVCHEVAHLLHQDHSPAFWKCVSDLCPQYKEGRQWLKVKGKELYRFE